MNMLVVIDSRIEAYPMLAAGVRNGAKVIVIDPNFDGIEQITRSLAEHPASSLHIVCHGEPGTLYLGKTPLNGTNLETYRHQLQQWHVSDILLYACNVAALEQRSRRETNNPSATSATNFLHRFHQLTKANIAASNHRVGSTHLGGDWKLEVQIGEITAPLAFLPATLNAYQGILAEDFIWAKGIGGAGNDGGNSIAVDSSGNAYITGSLNGVPSAIKVDSSGNQVWANSLGGTDKYTGNSISVDSSGNAYILSGTFNDVSPEVLTKLDNQGNLIWAKNLGGNTWFITADSNGNIYTTGDFKGTVDFDPGSGISNLTSTPGWVDIFVTKLDSNGNLVWAKGMNHIPPPTGAYPSPFNKGQSITVDSKGNAYITGRFADTVDFDPGSGKTTLSSFVGISEIFIIKLNSQGNLVWANRIDGVGNNASSITTDSSNNVYITGNLVAKLDNSGNLVWRKNFADAGFINGRSIIVDSSDNFYITGTLNGVADSFIKLDSGGNIVWVKNLGGAGNDIAIDSNDNLYITGGFSGTADFDPGSGIANLTSSGGSDIFITKLGNMPTISIDSPKVVEGTGGSKNLTFTITLSDASTVPISVDYLTVDGTATADSDYTKTEKVTTKFNPGDSLTQTISIPITTDNINEADETFYVQLSNAVNAKISSTAGKGTGTIINDDTPTVSIEDLTVTVTEGTGEGTTTANFTVTLSNPTDIPVTVNYTTADGSATAGKDYTTKQGTLTFDAKSEKTQNIAVDINRDNINEADETFTVNLTNTGASNATASATGKIINDDTPTISITDVSQKEGNSDTTNFTFDVTLSNPTDIVVTVDYFTVDDTATDINDYISKSGTLTFNPSSSLTQSVTVAVVGENFVEPDEKFKVKLSNPTNATIAGTGEGIGSIINDDVNEPQQPKVSIIPALIAQFEENSGTTAYTYNVSLSNPSSVPITVNYSTNDGTATVADNDYINNDGSLTFAPGSLTKTITVQVIGDTNVEPNENFTVNLNSASNATIDNTKDSAIGIINNDDDDIPVIIPTISINDIAVVEGTGRLKNAVFTVQLSASSILPVSVNYATFDVTAKAGSDYTAIPPTPLTFEPGEIAKTVTVAVNPDNLDEPDETFNVHLTDAINAIIADNTGVATILDDDNPVIPIINIAPGQSPSESGPTLGTFIISLNTAAPTPITVNFNTNSSTATLNTDYTFDLANSTNLTAIDTVNNTFTIPAGVTSATLAVQPVDDAVIEAGGEIIQLNLLSGTGYTLNTSSATTSFSPATNFPVGSSPVSVTVGDFNSDGKSDLATANANSNNISVLLGDGKGSFAPATNFFVGSSPVSVTVGDFNSDGKSDLATANANSNNISVLLGDGKGSFAPATNFSVGSSPVSVTVGDFNSDGKSDLATANKSSDNVSVLLGDGKGSFAPATNFFVGKFYSHFSFWQPSFVTVGDFNGDGFSDLATANPSKGGDVSVLLGDGKGSFAPATNFPVGIYPESLTVGDFNEDGKSDLAVGNLNFAFGSVILLLGDGTGNFPLATEFPVKNAPHFVTVGDFNNDGFSDIAAANLSKDVTVLLGDGKGSFAPATNFFVEGYPSSITVGDFNGDGFSDLATGNAGSNNVTVLLNQQQLTVTQTIADNDPVSVEFSAATYQVNEDGTPVGVAVTINRIGDAGSAASVQVQLTNGTATGGTTPFTTGTDFDNTIQTINFAKGDTSKTIIIQINDDSIAESTENFTLTLANSSANTTIGTQNTAILTIVDNDLPTVTLASGASPSESGITNGTFIITLDTPAPSEGLTIKFNTTGSTANNAADYLFDLETSTNITAIGTNSFTIAPGATSATLVLKPVDDAEIETGGETVQLNLDPGSGYRLGYGNTAVAQFTPETNFSVGSFPTSVTAGDFNQDGFNDLVTANQFSDDVSILLGTGDGTFGSATNFSVGSFPIAVTSGDFNQDGFLDLAAVNEFSDDISVLFGTGDGSFGSATNFSVGFDPVSVTAKDLNQDSFIDLVATNFGDNNVSVLLNTKDGSFGTATNFSVDSSPISVTVEDFNKDGLLDLATANFNTNDVSILLGIGDGNFGTATNFSVGLSPNFVTVGDFNQDGFLDLATANQNSDNLSVLLGTGDGNFGTATNFSVEFGPGSVATSDFNGDGFLDLAATNLYSHTVSILLGTGDGNFAAATNLAVGTNPASIVVDDFNNDGKKDLATANQSSDSVSVLLNNNIPTASLTIADNDPVSVEFSAASYQVNEDGTIVGAAVTINRIGDAQSPASVQVQLTNGTASGGSQPFSSTTDFDNGIQTINFASGETSQIVTIPINNDNWVEGNENLTLTLINPSANLVLGNQTTANLTIVDNDVAEISINDVTVAEGNSGATNAIFTVTLSNPNTQLVTVNYSTSDGSATVADGDYINIPTTLLTFNPGETSKTISVEVNGDEKVEGNETFNLNLSNATNAAIVDNKGVAIITNDDVSPIVNNVTSTAPDGNYTVGQAIPITVTFSKNVFVTGTPQLTLETGTTDAVANYTSGSGSNTLTFNYQVGITDTTADLDYIAANALVLNGGTIKDAAGNNAVLALPTPGTVGYLGANKAIAIPPLNNIIGTGGRDTLTGTSGSDRIIGEQVSDTLTGGLGNDEFVYNRIQDAGDFIMDFQVGSDRIVMTNLLASLGYSGGNAIADGYISFSTRGSDAIVNLDPDGFAGTSRTRLYITVKNVTLNALNNPNNFVFS